MIDIEVMSPGLEEREAIAAELGVIKCDNCLRLCPYCPRLLAVRPDLAYVFPKGSVPQPAPSPVRKAINLARATVQHVAAGLPHADDATVKQRLAICHTCNHFDVSHEACRLCGCNMPFKVRWAEQQCPIKKW